MRAPLQSLGPLVFVASPLILGAVSCKSQSDSSAASADATGTTAPVPATSVPVDTGVEPTPTTTSSTSSDTNDATGRTSASTGSADTTAGSDTGRGEDPPAVCVLSDDPIVLQQEVMVDSLGAYPWSMFVGDFDDDGNLDLATLNRDDDSVTLLRGDGTGGFAAQLPVTVPTFPKYAVVADFDQDGADDLVVSSRNGSTVSLLRGGGTFSAPTPAIVGLAPGAVTAGDLDGDGDLDLAVVNTSSSFRAAAFALGDGSGGFADPVWGEEFSAPHEMGYVLLEELTGDGIIDAVVVTSEEFRSYAGDGMSMFTEIASSGPGFGEQGPNAVIGDLDHDGFTDVWHEVSGKQNLVAWGTGPGTFAAPEAFGADNGSAGDLNGDGCSDFAGTNGNDLFVWRPARDGSFVTESPLNLSGPATDSVIADFTGDGNNDVVVLLGLGQRLAVYVNDLP